MTYTHITYTVRVGHRIADTHINTEKDQPGFQLIRLLREYEHAPCITRPVLRYKTLAAAVRASRRWVHNVMKDEYAKIS